MRSLTRLPALVFLSITCCLSPLVFGLGPLDVRLELISGQEVPGLNGRRLQYAFGIRTNKAGRIAFLARTRPDAGVYSEQVGVFVKEGDTVRKILHEGDRFPDAATVFTVPYAQTIACDINDSGVIAVITDQGVLLDDEAGLHWLVRKGAAVQGTSLTIQAFLIAEASRLASGVTFLTDSGAVLVPVRLSDGSNGLVRATREGVSPVLLAGQPVPGRPGLVVPADSLLSGLTVAGEFAGFMIGSQSKQFCFLQGATTVNTVAIGGDPLPGGKTLGYLTELSINGRGTAVLAGWASSANGKRSPEILTWSAQDGLFERLNEEFSLPAFPGIKATELGRISIDEEGRLFFGAILGV